MITKWLFQDATKGINSKTPFGNYKISSNDVAFSLLYAILFTPLTIVLDIVLIPVEIIYYICLKIVIKKRNKY